MKDLDMWVCELGGYWVWLSSSSFLFQNWAWPNPKEKTPHILKVTQHQNFYPRWVVDFFSKSCFVWIAFMNIISKPGTFSQFPLAMGQNLQKKSQKDLSSICMWFSFDCHNAKIHPKQTIHHDPPKLSSTQLHILYHQKPHHETGYKFLISPIFEPTEIFKILTMIFLQINLTKFHTNFGVKPLVVLRWKVLSFTHIRGSITNSLSWYIMCYRCT